ncbi:hypothetical protein BOVA604_3653 [Bacteroides ovatus]|nr:hypothetical protein BOVA604_3653 [Bacteroides ovatus]
MIFKRKNVRQTTKSRKWKACKYYFYTYQTTCKSRYDELITKLVKK